MSAAAHRHPGLVAVVYAHRALAGLVLALPAAAAIGGATAGYPRGQAELFDPGSVMLIESLRLARRAVPTVAVASGTAVLLATAFGLLPLGVAIAGLGREGRAPGSLLVARAWEHAGTLALLFGLGAAAQALTAAILVALGGKLIGALQLAPRTDDLAFVGLFTLVLAVLALIGVARDLGYVGAVHGGHGLYVACARALRGLRKAPGRAIGGYAVRAALGLAGLALAAWAAPKGAGAPGRAIAVSVLLHQAALAGAAFARVSWLAAGIRIVDATAPAGDVPIDAASASRETEACATFEDPAR